MQWQRTCKEGLANIKSLDDQNNIQVVPVGSTAKQDILPLTVISEASNAMAIVGLR